MILLVKILRTTHPGWAKEHIYFQYWVYTKPFFFKDTYIKYPSGQTFQFVTMKYMSVPTNQKILLLILSRIYLLPWDTYIWVSFFVVFLGSQSEIYCRKLALPLLCICEFFWGYGLYRFFSWHNIFLLFKCHLNPHLWVYKMEPICCLYSKFPWNCVWSVFQARNGQKTAT